MGKNEIGCKVSPSLKGGWLAFHRSVLDEGILFCFGLAFRFFVIVFSSVDIPLGCWESRLDE